jgi:hypothetical protein
MATEPADRLPGLATAGVASVAAGVVHAGAIGIHAEHPTLARLFIVVAVFQLAFGVVALVRPSRWLAIAGGVGNLVAVGVWLTTRLVGISFIDGLEVREPAQFTDTACALLGLVAAGLAISAALIGWHRSPAPNLLLAGLAACAVAIPAMFSGASHEHAHDTVSAASPSGAVAHDDEHVHAAEPQTTVAASTTTAHDHSEPTATTTLDAATAETLDESIPHEHNADGSVTISGGAAESGPAAEGATVALDPTTGAVVDESQPHVHEPTAAPPVPYDPTKPIDLGGVPGVTPEEQARAENLVAITLVRLPQWSDPATAEAAGFHSIGDAATGFEHYIQWSWINDDDTLDPDHPESLVYSPQPDGTKKLVSAMYMLPDTVALDQVPDIGGALTQWHIHDNLCFTKDPVAPTVAGLTDANGGCPSTLQKFQPAPMIHVWITPNECGPFAALEGVGAGQVAEGRTRNCDHAHGSTGLLG